MLDPEKLANKIAEITRNSKAKDICLIDIRGISILSDFFVICTGSSSLNVKAIADRLQKELSKEGINYVQKEGYEAANWILLDYGDVVVHIFHPVARELYNIEKLWNDGIFTYLNYDES